MRQEFYRDGLVIRTTAHATQRLDYPPRPADALLPTRARSLVDVEHTCPHCHKAECDDTRPTHRFSPYRPVVAPTDRPDHAGIWGILFPLAVGGALGILVMLWATAPW